MRPTLLLPRTQGSGGGLGRLVVDLGYKLILVPASPLTLGWVPGMEEVSGVSWSRASNLPW